MARFLQKDRWVLRNRCMVRQTTNFSLPSVDHSSDKNAKNFSALIADEGAKRRTLIRNTSLNQGGVLYRCTTQRNKKGVEHATNRGARTKVRDAASRELELIPGQG